MVIASTPSAVRLPVNAASASGIRSGSRPRVVFVADSVDATHATGCTSGCTSSRSAWNRRAAPDVSQATTNPPIRLAAALSACPSIPAESCSSASCSMSGSRPASTAAATTPDTAAAAELPSPRECGTVFVHRSRSPAGASPNSSNAWCMARTTRCRALRGTCRAPSPVTSTDTPGSGVAHTSISS